MHRALALLFAACAVLGVFASPASAAPAPANITMMCIVASGQPCTIGEEPLPGTGQDLHVGMGNKCDGASVCTEFLVLSGHYGDVVVDVANQCTNGATCRISVSGYNASFKSFLIRPGIVFGTYNETGINIQNRCDASSVCSISPSPGPYTPVTGGLCVTNQSGIPSCQIQGTAPGVGGDLHLVLGNKCSVPTICAEDWTLTGSFDHVVIDRANQCSNHATCTINVHIEAQINSLQIRDRGFVFPDGTLITNRCDATAVCTTTP